MTNVSNYPDNSNTNGQEFEPATCNHCKVFKELLTEMSINEFVECSRKVLLYMIVMQEIRQNCEQSVFDYCVIMLQFFEKLEQTKI
jgi:hypothetical protein